MKSTRTLIASAVAGVALAFAAGVFAQPYGGMGGGFGPGMGMGPGHGRMAGADHSAMVEYRLSSMKTLLKITAAQESAWQAFADQVKQQAASMDAIRTQMQQNSGTAPDRMAQHAAVMQQRAAAMTSQLTAFNALYAVLTPEQKTIADQNFGMMGGRGMGFGPRAS